MSAFLTKNVAVRWVFLSLFSVFLHGLNEQLHSSLPWGAIFLRFAFKEGLQMFRPYVIIICVDVNDVRVWVHAIDDAHVHAIDDVHAHAYVHAYAQDFPDDVPSGAIDVVVNGVLNVGDVNGIVVKVMVVG